MKLLLERWNNFLSEQTKPLTEEQKVALVIFGEAEGETLEGKRAVYHVINNRQKFTGLSMTEIIEQPRQFHAYEKGYEELNTKANANPIAKKAYLEVANIVRSKGGLDPTKGALHYYNPEPGVPAWGRPSPCWVDHVTIGKHVFGTYYEDKMFKGKEGRCYWDRPKTHPKK